MIKGLQRLRKSRISRDVIWAAALVCVFGPRPARAQITPPSTDASSLGGDAQFLYVANQAGNDISGYRIDAANGTLMPIAGFPISTGKGGPSAIATDPAGNRLFVTKANDNCVVGFSIDRTTGWLTLLPGSPFPTGSAPSSVGVDPSGKFVYVANLGSNNVSGYRLDSGSGRLVPLAGSPFTAGTSPSYIAIDPLGKFVYVTNKGSNSVSGFSINTQTGVLTGVPGSPFAAGSSPVSATVDPNERFVYVANQGSHDISGYSLFATTGELLPLSTSPFTVGATESGYSVTVDPTGTHVYVAGSGGIFGYAIDQSSTDFSSGTFPPKRLYGQLSPVSGSPFQGGFLNFVTIDYTGAFAFAADKNTNQVYALTLNSGVVTDIAGSPFATGAGPVSIALVRPSSIPYFSAVQVPYPNADFGSVEQITASGINSKGDVAGSLRYYPELGDLFGFGFLYTNGATMEVGADRTSTANGINDSDEVVGQTALTSPFPGAPPFQAFLYNPSTGLNYIDNVPYRESNAIGINNNGLVTGWLTTGLCSPFACNLGDFHAFLYGGNGLVDLGTLGGTYSAGLSINNLGEIVGVSSAAGGALNDLHLFLYTGGKLHDLGMPFGQSVSGPLINDLGVIVGSVGTSGFVYRGHGFEKLPLFPTGLNKYGLIVGVQNGPNGVPRANLDVHGHLFDLNRLVDPSMTLLTGTSGINDRGQIVVSGLNGQIYLLTPRK